MRACRFRRGPAKRLIVASPDKYGGHVNPADADVKIECPVPAQSSRQHAGL